MAWWWPTLEVDTSCQTINIRKRVSCVWLKTSICVCNRQSASVFRFHAQWKRGHLHYVVWSTSKLQRWKVLTFSIQKWYINCTFAHSLHVDITSNFHIAAFEPRMQLQHNILFVCWCSIPVYIVNTTQATSELTSESDVDMPQSNIGTKLSHNLLPREGPVGADNLCACHVPCRAILGNWKEEIIIFILMQMAPRHYHLRVFRE